ncbi:MAG: ankyrin repeat domain-containing protein [Alphaproteobacteria bacterium]
MGFFKTEKEKLQRRFHRARERGDAEQLRAAIAEGADIEDKGGSYYTALYRAVDSRQKECVAVLLENKADVNAKSSTGHTALIEAARDGSFDIAKMLIEHGADVNAARKDDGETALHMAARHGRGDVIKLLLESGANPKATDHRMNMPADLADKEHPRLADLIRGKQPEDFRKLSEMPPEGWQLTAKDEVSNILEREGIGYRLTEIFNFGSGIYTRIARNMSTGAESQSLRFFDEFSDRAAIDRAREALARLGGEAPSDSKDKLGKPLLAPPRPQGGTP